MTDTRCDPNDDSETINRQTMSMKPLDWVEFKWDLVAAPVAQEPLPEHYRIAEATAEDAEEIRKVVTRSLTLDPAWSAELDRVIDIVDEWVNRAFAAGHPIALRHGQRIIGCVMISDDPASSNNLAPGPCVSMEYRNRGFGTQLLAAALEFLRAKGVTQAVAATRASANAARSLYAKFGGIAEAADADRLLAA